MRSDKSLNPIYWQGFNDGVKRGKRQSLETFHKYLTHRLSTLEEIPGVGEKTAWKIRNHLIDELKKTKEKHK